MTTVTTDPTNTPNRASGLRTTWMVVGGLAIAAAGVGAGLTLRPAPGNTEPVRASQVSNDAVVQPGRTTDAAIADSKPVDTPVADAKPAEPKPVPAKPHPAPVHHAAAPTQHASNDVTPLATQPAAAVCSTCGVVEGVREVQQKGKGSGLGAVAGGVAGAAVGNQFGHGNGKAAMTILGAIGGGLAGNEVEKRVKTETVYEVRIRMDDGSMRTFTQKSAPAPGTRVTVDGNTLHTGHAPQGDSPQMVRTSAGA
ncbi:MAG: glycine zipper 2TM domain-containing protein [Rhizobacter sp.]